jgi:APA family basic amino acid/polyamine antiporter
VPDATDEPIEGGTSPEGGSYVGFGTATASSVIVSSMIGIGVLTTSGLAVDRLGSNQLMLMLWLLGGAVAACGALSLAEVSAALPRSGGEYAIFREAYGPLPAFLAGWVSFLFGFSAPIAVSASGASGYLLAPFGEVGAADGLARTALATALIVAITAAHVSGRGRSAKLQGMVTLLELSFLLAFTAAGLWWGRGGLANLDDRPPIDGATLGRMLFSLVYIATAIPGGTPPRTSRGRSPTPGASSPAQSCSARRR